MLYVGCNHGFVDITEDDYEKGADIQSCNSWDFELKEHIFENKQEFFDAVENAVNLNLTEEDFTFFEGSVRFSVMVDVDNDRATELDLELFKKGERKLYIADGYIPVCYLPDLPHEMTDEEAEEFGLKIEQ